MAERKICWRVTRYCNLHCEHCLAGHANSIRSDLSTADKLAAIREIIQAGIKRITWTGGEPTLCPDLPALLHECHLNGIVSVLTTHGLALNGNILNSLDSSLDKIRVSFDGLEKTHNEIRRGKFFTKAMDAASRVKDMGFDIEANISLLGKNIHEIPELMNMLALRGFSKIVLLSFMKRESALDNNIEAPTVEKNEILTSLVSRFREKHPSIAVQMNNYGDPADTYIVLESNGEILLCSEIAGDRSFGYVVGEGAEYRLRSALNEQTLAHRAFQ